MLRRFYYLTVQFFICSDCHPFWGQIVGMRKPGYLGADWFCAFRACCPTFCLNIFAICFILHTLSVPGNRLKNINVHYIHFCPVRTVHLVERALINTYAFSIYSSNYYSLIKNISLDVILLSSSLYDEKRLKLVVCPPKVTVDFYSLFFSSF